MMAMRKALPQTQWFEFLMPPSQGELGHLKILPHTRLPIRRRPHIDDDKIIDNTGPSVSRPSLQLLTSLSLRINVCYIALLFREEYMLNGEVKGRVFFRGQSSKTHMTPLMLDPSVCGLVMPWCWLRHPMIPIATTTFMVYVYRPMNPD